MSKKVLFSNKLINIIDFSKSNNSIKGSMLLIRNFENKGVLSGCLSGWLDNSITEYGVKQARYVVKNIMPYFGDHLNIVPANSQEKKAVSLNDNVFISDLKRADESLNLLFTYENINYKKFSLLRDINYGEYEGYYFDGLPKEKKQEISDPTYSFNKGESYLDVKFRALIFLFKYYNNLANNFSLIISHNIFISSLISSTQPLKNGDIMLISLNQNNNSSDKLFNKDIVALLSEYKNNYYMKNSSFQIANYYENFNNRFNSILNELLEVKVSFRLPNMENEEEVNESENIIAKNTSKNN